jgi:hypothetical protein
MQMMNDMMTVGGNMKDMGMNMSLQQMDMNVVMYPEISGELESKRKKKKRNNPNIIIMSKKCKCRLHLIMLCSNHR